MARLRAHLVELDRELSEEAERNQQLAASYEQQLSGLQSELQQWKSLYEQRVHQIEQGDDYEWDDESGYPSDWSRAKLIREYGHLKQIIETQDKQICALSEAHGNLQSALAAMESTMQADLDLALAQTRAIAKEADQRANQLEHELKLLKVKSTLQLYRGIRWIRGHWKS